MPNTMIHLNTVTVGAGGAASINFTNIPSTYTDLLIYLSGRSDTVAQTYNGVALTFNGTSNSANWVRKQIEGGDGSIASYTSTASIGGYVPAPNATASAFGSIQIYVHNYASSNDKLVSIESVTEGNTATTGYYADLVGQLWTVGTAINQVTLTMSSSANFVQYSSASIYGIKNS